MIGGDVMPRPGCGLVGVGGRGVALQGRGGGRMGYCIFIFPFFSLSFLFFLSFLLLLFLFFFFFVLEFFTTLLLLFEHY